VKRGSKPREHVQSNVTWIGLIQLNFDEGGPSPYIFKKGDNNLAPSLSSKQRRDKILDRVT